MCVGRHGCPCPWPRTHDRRCITYRCSTGRGLVAIDVRVRAWQAPTCSCPAPLNQATPGVAHDACVLAATTAPRPALMTVYVLHIDAVLDGVWRRAACGCRRSRPRPVLALPPFHQAAPGMAHDASALAATAAPCPALMTGDVLHIDTVLDGVWPRATRGCVHGGPPPVPAVPLSTKLPQAWRTMLVRWPPRLPLAPRS